MSDNIETLDVENNNSNNINNNEVVVKNTNNFNYVKFFIDAFIKPYSTFKNNEDNLKDIKIISILAAIIVIFLTIFNLIQTMISAVIVTSIWSGQNAYVFSNLAHIKYLQVIGSGIITYAVLIGGIAGIYYLASLVIKKNSNFLKLLGVVITSIIPYAISSSLVAYILGLFYLPFRVVIVIFGLIYSIIIFYELVNEIIVIEDKDLKIYFHLVCCILIYILTNLIML